MSKSLSIKLACCCMFSVACKSTSSRDKSIGNPVASDGTRSVILVKGDNAIAFHCTPDTVKLAPEADQNSDSAADSIFKDLTDICQATHAAPLKKAQERAKEIDPSGKLEEALTMEAEEIFASQSDFDKLLEVFTPVKSQEEGAGSSLNLGEVYVNIPVVTVPVTTNGFYIVPTYTYYTPVYKPLTCDIYVKNNCANDVFIKFGVSNGVTETYKIPPYSKKFVITLSAGTFYTYIKNKYINSNDWFWKRYSDSCRSTKTWTTCSR